MIDSINVFPLYSTIYDVTAAFERKRRLNGATSDYTTNHVLVSVL